MRSTRAQRGRPLVGRQLAVERAEHVHDGGIREAPLLEVEAPARQDARALPARVGRHLADQARLADTCLAADERHGSVPRGGAVVRVDQARQFRRSADERGRRRVSAHVTIIAPPPGRTSELAAGGSMGR
jgi:hypothetical protein